MKPHTAYKKIKKNNKYRTLMTLEFCKFQILVIKIKWVRSRFLKIMLKKQTFIQLPN